MLLTPNDFGPIYAETDMTRFPVEPFNTVSNIIFLWLVIHYSWRTRFDWHRYPLLTVSLPILFIGFIGGTVFHATRSHSAWLILDFVPIGILSFLAAAFLWRQATGSWGRGIIFLLLFMGLPRFISRSLELPRGWRITVGYALLGLGILLPALITCIREKWAGVKLLILSFISFSLALSFRLGDKYLAASYLYMGSHFLWHIFGGLSVWCLLEYIYLLEGKKNALPVTAKV